MSSSSELVREKKVRVRTGMVTKKMVTMVVKENSEWEREEEERSTVAIGHLVEIARGARDS